MQKASLGNSDIGELNSVIWLLLKNEDPIPSTADSF